MILGILEQKLDDADLGLERGVSLFRSNMPGDITKGVMTRIPLEGLKQDPDVPSLFKGRIQVIVRDTHPDSGAQVARSVNRALVMRGSGVFTGEQGERIQIKTFIPETLPIEFPRLEGDGIEWSTHFETVFSVDLSM